MITDSLIVFPTLLANYATALRYARYRLNRFPHGHQKPWAREYHFNYVQLINLKEVEAQINMPLIQRLLTVFDFSVAVIRLFIHGGKTHFFIFSTGEELAQFSRELAAYCYLVSLVATA